MKEQLISFKTAELAKKCGYDVITNQQEVYYPHIDIYEVHNYKFGTLSYPKEIIYQQTWDYDFIVSNRNVWHQEYYLAPKQAFLQRWLREKQKIIILVDFVYDTNKYAASFHTLNQRNVIDGFTMFDTYEDALEEGLQEGLTHLKNQATIKQEY